MSESDLRDMITDIIRSEFPQPEKKSEYLSVKEVAKLLGVSPVTIHAWKEDGILKAYRVSTRIRFKRSDIESSMVEVGKS